MIPNLEDGVACTSFLNGLKNGQVKFFLAKQAEAMLTNALKKALIY